MRRTPSVFHVAVGGGGGKEKILEQKFPCVMSGWTTGLSGLLAWFFRPSWSRIPQRRVQDTRWSRQQDGGNCPAAVWRRWRRWQRWRCLVADSRAEVARNIGWRVFLLQLNSGLEGSEWWPSLRRARHLTSGHNWAAPDCTSCPGSPPFPKCRVQAWGGRNATTQPKVTVSYYYMSHPMAVLLPSHSPSPPVIQSQPPSNLFSWVPNAAAGLVMPRPGTAIARFYPCTPPS